MAKINRSALKRTRQAEKRRLRNKSYKSFIKTLTKKFMSETNLEEKEKLLNQLYKALDKAVSKGIIHENTAARKKSKAAKKLLEFKASLNQGG